MISHGPESGLRLAERGLLHAADRFRARHSRELSLLVHARLRFALGGALLVALVAALAVTMHARLGHVVRAQITKVLHVARDAAIEGALMWTSAAQRAAEAAGNDPTLAIQLADCLAGQGCDAAKLGHDLEPYMRSAGFSRYRLVDASGEVLMSAPARAVSTPLPAELRALAAPLQRGAVTVVAPLHADRRPLMFVLTRVDDGVGSALGALVFDLPTEGLDRVLRAARAGESGETYAIDVHGRMLTESRFDAQLHRIGLLPAGEANSALALDVRDPGGDMTQGFLPSVPRAQQPLTRMAADVVRGHEAHDLNGYRDYRGVMVVGCWRWLPALGIGVATEVDSDEALHTLHALRRLFAWMVGALGFALAGLLAALWLAARMRTRAFRAEQLAERFGQYRIRRKLGQGGMGRVYLADHELLRRPAAIKLLRPDRVSAEAVAGFEHEVQITSTLTHPNTIAVYDYGRAEDGSLYYVMEYLEGVDLQRLITRWGPLPCERVIHMLRQLCGSLGEAHARGLVHRDIKPANLLVCARVGMADTLKVLDFGVAHVMRAARIRVSNEKVLVGTPEYMAPEVLESTGQASPQTDLYAVGAVGYFLLTGRPPFEAETTQQLCLAHLTATPELPSRVTGHAIDPVLERAVMLCLSKRRQARPASAEALSAMLARSELAQSWTSANAESWWASHAAELELELGAESRSHSTAPSAFRPSMLG